jgi:hypothetical protein
MCSFFRPTTLGTAKLREQLTSSPRLKKTYARTFPLAKKIVRIAALLRAPPPPTPQQTPSPTRSHNRHVRKAPPQRRGGTLPPCAAPVTDVGREKNKFAQTHHSGTGRNPKQHNARTMHGGFAPTLARPAIQTRAALGRVRRSGTRRL